MLLLLSPYQDFFWSRFILDWQYTVEMNPQIYSILNDS